MILVIDNYDSFTFNLVHYLMELGAEVDVVRNDAMSAGQAISSGAQAFLFSPGPKTPNEAGISLGLVAACAGNGTGNAQVLIDQVFKFGPALFKAGGIHVGQVVRNNVYIKLLGDHTGRGSPE